MTLQLSVIIPTYNVASYIAATLDSLANQSLLPAEIIVVDDGSTDNTVEVVQQHPLNERITIVEQENQGQGVARNHGVSLATGDYIYFLDSDDVLTDNFIAEIADAVAENNAPDLMFFSGREFQDESYSGSAFNPPNYLRPYETAWRSQEAFFADLLTVPDLSCSPCLYVSKRSLWQDQKLSFNEFYHEDEELFYRLIFAAQSYYMTQEVYFLRRLRDGSTMSGKKQPKHALGLHALLQSLVAMAAANRDKPLRMRLIRRRIRRFAASYIFCCRLAKVPVDLRLVSRAARELRHIRGHLSIVRALLGLGTL